MLTRRERPAGEMREWETYEEKSGTSRAAAPSSPRGARARRGDRRRRARGSGRDPQPTPFLRPDCRDPCPLVARGVELGLRSRRRRRYVEHNIGRSLVEEPLDELHERLRILKRRTRVQASDDEELPVALDAPIYPPGPHFLTLAPASDLHSGQASPSFRYRRIGSWPRSA